MSELVTANLNSNWSLQKYLIPFHLIPPLIIFLKQFISAKKKLKQRTTTNIFLSLKIYYTLIFSFHNAICIRVASIPNSFALHLPTTAARADASNSRKQQLHISLSHFPVFLSFFLFSLPFSFPFTYNENELRIKKIYYLYIRIII